jgi:adenine-specific DNA-methyltransferase
MDRHMTTSYAPDALGSTSSASSPVARQQEEKFRHLLRELFMFDQADLDFGIYRIMNARRDEITRFLDHDLLPQVRAALAGVNDGDHAQLQAEVAKAEEQARALGMEPDAVPRVQELRRKYAAAPDRSAVEAEVFSHLTQFFRRYYSEGDFVSQRRYKAGVYAIPYEGEEVKLHWANADQYYVKTSEQFRDYAFRVADGRRVHFRLVEADTARDNNKAAPGAERRFVLADDPPISEEGGELVLPFAYRPVDGNPKQKELTAAAVQRLTGAGGLPDAWRAAVLAAAPTAKQPGRTLLERHLAEYTARNTFDYFIHKDLRGFLRRELDFYVKSEVVHLDDIEHDSAPRVEQYLGKVRAIRRVAHKIIDLLAQLEEFQKRLWLKKKFVIETQWCVTLDRVPEALYAEIAANDAQREEWVRLFAIDAIAGDLATPGYAVPLTVAFLNTNPFLVVDTRFFSAEFKLALVKSFEDVDAQTDGLLVHGDNFQALNVLMGRYQGQVRCVYIDPPYNTTSDDFLYKDNYQHSSWIALIASRLNASTAVMSDDAGLFVSLDITESPNLVALVRDRMSSLTRLGEFVWKTRNTDNRVSTRFSVDHEYIHVFVRQGAALLGRIIDRSNFSNPDSDPRGDYTTDPLTGKANARDRPNLHYTIVNPATGDQYPPEPDFGWITDYAGYQQLLADDLIAWPKNPVTGKPRKKRFLLEASERAPISSLGVSITQGEGNEDLAALFGAKVMNFPKPVSVMRSIVDCSAGPGDIVLDFFAGSGTTGQATIELNRRDGTKLGFRPRRYVLVESGEHFDAILRPRIVKSIYASGWAGGKPLDRSGVSQLVKYIRLESYEDTLANLSFRRTDAQQALLDAEPDYREDYLLRYQLDVETNGSPSLLAVDRFATPFAYTLKVGTGSAGETREVAVDLVETFNYLLGLRVRTVDTIRGVRVVTGTSSDGERVLVLWRTVAEVDAAALNAWFEGQGYSTRDQEFDVLYVNGDNALENLRRPDSTWKVRLTEEEFHRRMFDVRDV